MSKLSRKQFKRIKKTIIKSGLFNENFYREQFDTLPEGELLEYYIENGINEDKSPSALFDNAFYIENNKDVYAAGVNPLYHYITYGKNEGRLAKADNEEFDLYQKWCISRLSDTSFKKTLYSIRDFYVIFKSGMFDSAWYLEKNADVAEYLRKKTAWKWRLSKNPALKNAGRMLTTPIAHYLRYGMFEGRNPSEEFSTSFYMNNNPDLIHGRYLTPFVHYIEHGKAEGRAGRKIDEFGLSFFDIFSERKQQERSDKPLSLSIISDNSPDVAYPEKEIIAVGEGLKTAIKNSTGDVIWICRDNPSEDYNEFVEKAMSMFEDEAVYAVVRCETSSGSDMEFVSYKVFALNEETINGRCFDYSDVLLRNPCNFIAFNDIDEINSVEDFNILLLRSVCGGEVGIVGGDGNQSYTKDLNYYKQLTDLVINRYASANDESRELFLKVRSRLHKDGGISYGDFYESIGRAEAFKARRLNVMIAIFSFTFGGGEIMPIRLANELFKCGHNVTVLSMLREPNEEKVRKMLLPDIPVVYSRDKDEINCYVQEFDIQAFNSHHQAIQQIFSETIDRYPELAQKVLNVATSHGMYEDLDESAKKYLFEETNLIDNTDFWTYVADKNILPFKKFGVYNDETFLKVPNGMEMPEINPVDLSEYGITENSFVITLISRALKEKGWLNAINAVTEIRKRVSTDVHLLLVGEGSVYDEYSQELGNSFIHFLGFRDNPCDYFSVSDLCILPSYYPSESAPLCLIEGMMCGIPAVASNIGDIKYILECEGKLAGNIFELENNTVNDNVLADCILEMINNKDLYNKAAETAKKKRSYYLIDNVVRMYLSVYEKYCEKTNTALALSEEEIEKINTSAQLLIDAEGNNAPKVSVIVPNYNHSAFLRKRLDCIYQQTYSNIEVILMDDCSSDNSREILTEYAEKYPDITKVIFNEENSGGVFFQWAKGVNNASGDLCWIAESDDYCEDNLLEALVPYFKEPDVKLAYAKYCFVDENDNKDEIGFFNYVGYIDKNKWHSSYINDADNEVDTALGIINSIPNASGAVFRNPKGNRVFDDAQWYKMKICGDWIFYLHIIKGGKVAYSVDTTSYFRFHSSNSSAKTYTNSHYYTEHEKVASLVRCLYHVDRSVIERNNEKIRAFYHSHIDGTDEEFESYYSVDRAMKWLPDMNEVEDKIKEQKAKYSKEYKTVVVNPIKSATDSDELSFEQKMEFVGHNTGNMLFVSAVKEQVEYIDEIWFNNNALVALDEKQPVSGVIPSSNFIIAGEDSTVDDMRRIYEKTTSPITMAGLGAQAYAPYDTPRKLVSILSKNKIDFFRMAAERAVSLGVRGEFTAECLEIMGIKNYRIIGCPTCFKYLDGIYKALPVPSKEKVIFNVTGKTALESDILKFGIKNNAALLMQMATELPQILYGEDISDEQFRKSFPELNISKDKYIEFVKSNGRIFFDMDKWNDFMQAEGFTFSFGSRFHGNMSACRNGIPSLWITHDSRTSELIETLKLPHIPIGKFKEVRNMQQLIEYCDYSEFYKNYEQLTKEYASFLSENGLDSKFRI